MSIIEDAKFVVKLVQEDGNLELKQKIVNLQGGIISLVQERNELKSEVDRLNEFLKIKQFLIFEQNVYWVKEKDRKEGPFCPICQDTKKQLVRLQINKDNLNPSYYCGSCREWMQQEIHPDITVTQYNSLGRE